MEMKGKKMQNGNQENAIKKLVYVLMVSVLEWYQLDISCNLTKEIHLINATSTILKYA